MSLIPKFSFGSAEKNRAKDLEASAHTETAAPPQVDPQAAPGAEAGAEPVSPPAAEAADSGCRVARVETWDQLMAELFRDTFNENSNRIKSRFAYRGASTLDYTLTPTLLRHVGPGNIHLERHMLRQFQKYSHNFAPEQPNRWSWISLAQHYGLPTRLLDWTYSPQVALHFATANLNKFQQDGVIWRVNYIKVHELLPTPILEDLRNEESGESWIFTVDTLADVFETIGSLEQAAEQHQQDLLIFFEPPAIDARIYNQFAYFSVCSNPRLKLDDWLNRHPGIWDKIVIPHELKWEIRDKLDQSNISERILMPGLDGLATWLKRYYMPTGKYAERRGD